ncbi:MAG: 4-oxalocrotonate tautomerase family protein [Actinomycetota bacterium]|nr:4-oxalocrotonate tautomerase family protein [Actinomycetota bacterium]
MPVIQCDIREGRTESQKQALARGIAQVAQETIGSPAEYVYVLIREAPGPQHFHGGEFLPDYRVEC